MVREPCLASVLPCGGRIALGDACGQKMAALFLVGWMPFFERVLGCAFDLPVRVWCILEMSVIFFSAAIFVVFCAVCVGMLCASGSGWSVEMSGVFSVWPSYRARRGVLRVRFCVSLLVAYSLQNTSEKGESITQA